MSFDPSTNDAVLAALMSRVDVTFPIDAAAFKFEVVAGTQRLNGDSFYQRALRVDASRSRVALAWSAVYRRCVLVGTILVCNTEQQDLATAMLLTEATAALDAVDLKLLTTGSPFALYPNAGPGYR